MTYPRSHKNYERDARIFEQLMKLNPGEELKLTFQTKAGAQQKRYLIYGWLKENKLKNFFRVRWPDDTVIVITKLEVAPEIACFREELPPKLDVIFKELITNAGTDEAAREILRDKKTSGLINPEELGILICKYDEFMRS